jgi:hypothetical protein
MLESHSESKGVGFVVCQVVSSAFISMATRVNLTDWGIMEMTLELDSYAHSPAHKDISARGDSDTNDITDIKFTQWTGNTNCWPIVPVVHRFTGGPSGLQQRHSISTDFSPLSTFIPFFFEILQELVEDTNKYYHNNWKRIT